MTSTDRLAEMAAEISRLRTKIVGLEAIVADNEARVANTHGMAAVIERLRGENEFLQCMHAKAVKVFGTERDSLYARIAELEGHAAVTFGTLEQPTPDEPTTITHGHAPSAPPHDER